MRRVAVGRAVAVSILVGLFASVLAAPAHASAAQLDRAAVDRFVGDYVQRHGLPGAAVATACSG